jgi:hypothetical protein
MGRTLDPSAVTDGAHDPVAVGVCHDPMAQPADTLS